MWPYDPPPLVVWAPLHLLPRLLRVISPVSSAPVRWISNIINRSSNGNTYVGKKNTFNKWPMPHRKVLFIKFYQNYRLHVDIMASKVRKRLQISIHFCTCVCKQEEDSSSLATPSSLTNKAWTSWLNFSPCAWSDMTMNPIISSGVLYIDCLTEILKQCFDHSITSSYKLALYGDTKTKLTIFVPAPYYEEVSAFWDINYASLKTKHVNCVTIWCITIQNYNNYWHTPDSDRL